jgi:hypothetical protein
MGFSTVGILLLLNTVQAGTSDHRYKADEHVELWVNKVRRAEQHSACVVVLRSPRYDFCRPVHLRRLCTREKKSLTTQNYESFTFILLLVSHPTLLYYPILTTPYTNYRSVLMPILKRRTSIIRFPTALRIRNTIPIKPMENSKSSSSKALASTWAATPCVIRDTTLCLVQKTRRNRARPSL